MVCPYCKKNTRVYNSRARKQTNEIWRRRICKSCNTQFTTIEHLDLSQVWRVRDVDGNLTDFNYETLFLSIYEILGHRKNPIADSRHLAHTVIGKIERSTKNAIIDKSFITKTIIICLNRFDKVAGNHYQAYHLNKSSN